ncbi:DUF1616 domain-containing protein [Halomarina halobia]|uniref:DUF1616 domain-containing protein n=1 Tax=Halomarina halobia TaxID=3033386 RepID=A0ABD6A841_9EURY|nr:DUF1616 domain-containing protein [Halomarina sp. PSR21]
MSLRLLVPRPIRELPADLVAVVGLTLLADVFAVAPVLSETPIRVVLALAFVLFVPGYALVAALFPERAPESAEDGDGITGVARVALSIGTSVAVVPMLALVLNFTPLGVRLVPILLVVSAVTIAATAVAARRRARLPPEERFAVPYREWYGSLRAGPLRADTRTDRALNVLLALSVLIAMSGVTYALVSPKQSDQYSELYLLTEGEDGELVADGYDTNLTRGERGSVIVGVENHEHERTRYTLVVQLQRVRSDGNETTVTATREVDRFDVSLAHDEATRGTVTYAPSTTGRLRLVFLLYRGPPPQDPSVENAYLETHLWLSVE